MTARILMTCWPFAGHVGPFVAVAKELLNHGHEVAIYTGEATRSAIEADGITVLPFREIDERHVADLVARVDRSGPGQRQDLRTLAGTFREWFVETIPQQVADINPIIREWNPDVICTDPAMWGPIVILWEKTSIPVSVLTFMLSPLIPGPDGPISELGMPPAKSFPQRMLKASVTNVSRFAGRPMRRRTDEIRADHGLPPLHCTVNEFTSRLPLYIVPNVTQFDFNRRDLPPSVHYVGPLPWRRFANETGTSSLDDVPNDRPWVHVTESTLRYGEPFLLKAAATGLSDGAFRVIMTSGTHRSVSDTVLGDSSEFVRILPWVDHDELLTRCAAMVSTGGAGTVMAAVLAGIPQIVVPTAWDKPDNATRVVESGVGLRLSPRNCTPMRLRAAVDEVVSNPMYADNTRRIREMLLDAPGAPEAVELILELAKSRH